MDVEGHPFWTDDLLLGRDPGMKEAVLWLESD